jgi:hypothetical protein
VDAFFLVIFHFCYWFGVCVELGLVLLSNIYLVLFIKGRIVFSV